MTRLDHRTHNTSLYHEACASWKSLQTILKDKEMMSKIFSNMEIAINVKPLDPRLQHENYEIHLQSHTTSLKSSAFHNATEVAKGMLLAGTYVIVSFKGNYEEIGPSADREIWLYDNFVGGYCDDHMYHVRCRTNIRHGGGRDKADFAPVIKEKTCLFDVTDKGLADAANTIAEIISQWVDDVIHTCDNK